MLPERKEPIIREGLYFIIPLLVAAIAAAILQMHLLASLIALLLFFCIWFFRNPERAVAAGGDLSGAIVSPADGRIIRIEESTEERHLQERCLKVSIFMNVFDVHVNRIPCDGRIEALHYQKGSFLSADLDRASEHNEKNLIGLVTPQGRKVVFVQVAGLIARRIICWLNPGMDVARGERFGLICFGSRVDLFLPLNARIDVKIGDRVKSGSTIIGWLL